MKFTREEKLDIGRQLYQKELTIGEAMKLYGMGRSTVTKCLTDYKRANGIPVRVQPSTRRPFTTAPTDIETYMSMSKEELINELIIAKANELRAKKGYEVKGVGASKEFVPLSNRNLK
jgi:transposase